MGCEQATPNTGGRLQRVSHPPLLVHVAPPPVRSLTFYVREMPLTLGGGSSHVQPWAQGDHCMLPEDAQLAPLHARIDFEPLSRTYELTLLSSAGGMIDGHTYGKVGDG